MIKLSGMEIGLLRLCALDDWTKPEAQRQWNEFRKTWGPINEAALLTRLYRLGLVDVGNRITLLGKVELWDADIRAEETIAKMAS